MKIKSTSLKTRFGFCMILLLAITPASFSNLRPARETITGTVIGISGRLAGRSAPFTLIVNKFTTADELTQLKSALEGGGQDRLMDVLSKMQAGRIQVGNNVGVDANVIASTPQGEGGTKVTVIYRRTIQFFELRYGTRSTDYKFGYAEIYLDRNGKGEGTWIPASKISLQGENTWVVEDFGEFPARIMGVQLRGEKTPG